MSRFRPNGPPGRGPRLHAATLLLLAWAASAASAQTCPAVSVSCRPSRVAEDEQFRCTARHAPAEGHPADGYVWDLTAGEIVGDTRRRSITVSPVGAGGQTIRVTVQLANCEPALSSVRINSSHIADNSGERVDLSGTYTGRVTTTGGHEMSGEATLTITGNTFTLSTAEGRTHTGRVYAVLTRGATSAAFYFSDVQDPATGTPLVFNVRTRKSGDRLVLTPAPNVTGNRMMFGTAASRSR